MPSFDNQFYNRHEHVSGERPAGEERIWHPWEGVKYQTLMPAMDIGPQKPPLFARFKQGHFSILF